MSDWGAVHSGAMVANAGLDQESGFPFDGKPFFGSELKQALAGGSVAQSRLDDMVFRILRQLYDKGVIDEPVRGDRPRRSISPHTRKSRRPTLRRGSSF